MNSTGAISPYFRTKLHRFFLALPLGASLFLFLSLLRWYTRFFAPNIPKLPKNAVVFMSHPDIYVICCNPQFARDLGFNGTAMGDHSLLSYAWYPWHLFLNYRVFRILKDAKKSPTEQICDYLNRTEDRLWIFTDSGGPYGVVRPSLIKISKQTKRPLYALRHELSPCITLFGHQIPLPFARVKPYFSKPVLVENVEQAGDLALALFQRALDSVRAPAHK